MIEYCTTITHCTSPNYSHAKFNFIPNLLLLEKKKILLSEKDVFSCQFEDICTSTCDVVSKGSFLPSALVGAYGEGIVMPTLRLLSTIAENGSAKVIFQQIVRSGVLLPVTDMLRDAMVGKELKFMSNSPIVILSVSSH